MDVISPQRLTKLKETLAREYPDARLLAASTRAGRGLVPWFALLEREIAQPKRVMEVDYARYGTGEALLGWYNARITLTSPPAQTIDGNEWLIALARAVHEDLRAKGVEIAHFKMILAPAGGAKELAAVNLVRTAAEPEAQRRLRKPLTEALLTVNLRAETAPEVLTKAVRAALKKSTGVKTEVTREEAFRPGQPKPTHRVPHV